MRSIKPPMASLQTDQDTTQKVEPASFVKDRVITVDVKRTLGPVHDRFADMRAELLAERVQQRAERAAGHMERNAATADLRAAAWTVDPLPESLLDRRVELLGGRMTIGGRANKGTVIRVRIPINRDRGT